jgi:hypothetical protein
MLMFQSYAVLRSKSKDWFALNQDNVSNWVDMSTLRMLFQWASTINIQLRMLVLYKVDISIISFNVTCYSDIAEKLLPWCYTTHSKSNVIN